MAKRNNMGWIVVNPVQEIYERKVELHQTLFSMPKDFSIGNSEIIISQDSLNRTRSENKSKMKLIVSQIKSNPS